MKKLIIAIFIILFCSFQASAWNPVMISSGNTGSSATCDTTNIAFWWRAEALDFSSTNSDICTSGTIPGGADCSDADDTGTAGGGAVINTDASYFAVGNGLDCPSNYDSVYFDDPPSLSMDEEGRIGFWLKIITWADMDVATYGINESVILFYRNADNRAQLVFAGSSDSDIELQFYWEDSNNVRSVLETTTANMVENTWYFVEIAWNVTTNERLIYVDGTQYGYDTGTINAFSGDVFRLYMCNNGDVSVDFHLDNIIYTTDSTQDLYTVCKDEESFPN